VHEKRLESGTAHDELIAWQQETCRKDLRLLQQFSSGLLIADVTAADSAGHDFGGASPQYRETARAVDACLALIARALSDGRTTLIVTSDHGHIDGGGHGGEEEEVVHVPLVLAGSAIRVASGWRALQIDIAPTISALLGLPFPSTNQGSVLWQALDLPADTRQQLHEREQAQKTWLASHLPGRDQTLQDEKRDRSLRALAFFTAFWFLACAVALGYRGQWRSLLLAAGLYYAAYHALFWLFGLRYSLSAINRQEYLFHYLGKDVVASAAAFCLAALVLLPRCRKPPALVALDFALLVAATLLFQITWIYYQHGLFMQRAMLDLHNAFKAYLDLVALAAIGFAAPLFALCVRGCGPAIVEETAQEPVALGRQGARESSP
jgi:hypothetical protein